MAVLVDRLRTKFLLITNAQTYHLRNEISQKDFAYSKGVN